MWRWAWCPSLAICLVLGPSVQACASDFSEHALPGVGGAQVRAIERGALTLPERFQVVVIPGSGCAGMGPVADRYFAGLLHARVLVLHKRTVSPDATTASSACSADFVRQDAHSLWLADARAALSAWRTEHASSLPLVLVGISEGAELVPALAASVPPKGVVLIGGSGLDPVQAARLQAERLGEVRAWEQLARAVAGGESDESVIEGRSLRYWRDLWQWPVQEPLLQGPWPMLRIWGSDDALIPRTAYERFDARARGRAAAHCVVRLPGADHGLQAHERDGVQWLWSRLERWARTPRLGWCAAFTEFP